LLIKPDKTNAFAELETREMMDSTEYGQDLTERFEKCKNTLLHDDSIVVIRVYDTHLPYGRGISPCDAESNEKIRKKVAEWYRKDEGRTLMDQVAVPSLQRACGYLEPLWDEIHSRLDLTIIMSDHGDNWYSDADQVGHARFLTNSVLHVPLVVVDGKRKGRFYRHCNNVDIVATILECTGKSIDWKTDSRSLFADDRCRDTYMTEANSQHGRYWRASIVNPNIRKDKFS